MESAFIPAGGLEVRTAGNTHELEGLCVPYNRPTAKAGVRPEVFRPGAFANAPATAKVRLIDENHAMSGRRPVGIATRLADTADGLVGAFRFYDTPEGRAAFENVREETYGGLSIGFVAVREADASGMREILEARLHHVSLVDEPAYDDAQILSVRAASQYEWMRAKPTIDVAELDDTPMSVLVRRALGDVRSDT